MISIQGDKVELYDDDRLNRSVVRDATITLDDRGAAWRLWAKLTGALLWDLLTRWFR